MFDKELFSKLLEKAQGERSINQYGQQCGVDPVYVLRLLRGLKEQSPSAEIIKKLAAKARDGVTTEQLMAAAGYVDKSENNKPSELPDTIAPYLPEDFDEFTPEAKKEILDFVEYVMHKHKKKSKGGPTNYQWRKKEVL